MAKIASVEQSIAARGPIDGGVRASAQNNAFSAIGESINDIGLILQQKADQDEKLRQANFMIDSQIKWEQRLTDMKNEFPQGSGYTEKVLQEYEKFSQESVANVAPRYRNEFEGQLLNFKGSIVNSAISTEARLKTSYQKNLFQDQLNLVSNRARAEGYIDEGLYGSIEKKIDLFDVDPSVKESFRDMLKNDVGSAYIQGLIEKNPAQAVEVLKSEEYQGALDNKLYNSLLNKAESTVAANAVKLEKIKFTDPVQYETTINPALADNPEALIEAQQARGVPPVDISVLTNDTAKSVVSQITKAQSAEDFISIKSAIKDKYGQYYDVAVKDLYKNELPMDYQLLFAMDENQNVDEMQAMMRVVKGGGSLSSSKNAVISLAKDKAAADGDNFERDITRKVLENLSKTQQLYSAMGMPDKYRDNLNNSVVAMASAFYSGGLSKDEAVEKATKWITDSYEVKAVNGVDYMIPISSEYDADVVHKRLLGNLSKLEIKFPVSAQRSKNYNEVIKQTAVFATNANKDGVYLLLPDGSNVFDKYSDITENGLWVPAKDAKQVELKFSDAFQAKLSPDQIKKIREDGKRLKMTEGQIQQMIKNNELSIRMNAPLGAE